MSIKISQEHWSSQVRKLIEANCEGYVLRCQNGHDEQVNAGQPCDRPCKTCFPDWAPRPVPALSEHATAILMMLTPKRNVFVPDLVFIDY